MRFVSSAVTTSPVTVTSRLGRVRSHCLWLVLVVTSQAVSNLYLQCAGASLPDRFTSGLFYFVLFWG